jgi:hypothetical protein
VTLRLAVLTLALTTVLAFGFSACSSSSGGRSLTLEEYFQRLEELDAEADSQSSTAEARAGDFDDVDVVIDAFAEFITVIDIFMRGLEDLTPPPEAQAAHDAALETGSAFQEAFQTLVNEGQGVETLDELGAILNSEAFDAADQAFTDACLDLEQIATDNDITADLNCEGDEEES